MKKNLLLGLVTMLLLVVAQAQQGQPVTISGRVCSDKDSVKLLAWFAKDIITEVGAERQKILAPVGKDGRFSFTTPPFNGVARLSLHDMSTGNQLFSDEEQFVKPGDRIELFGNIHDQGDPYYFKAVFFGKGAARYECVQALKAIKADVLNQKRPAAEVVQLYDSLLNSKLTTLENFRSRLSESEYNLFRLDITGDLRIHALTSLCGFRFGSYYNKELMPAELTEKKKEFNELIAHFSDTIDNNEANVLSVTYRKYLYLRARSELVFDRNGAHVTMGTFFQKLKQQHSGLMREKLLGALLLSASENFFFFGGTDPDEELQCFKEAYAMINDPVLKERFMVFMNDRAKGAVAYNFVLQVDSSQTKTLSLADLKGKVVLLDLWGYSCTGCMLFTQAFHQKIYPAFKDNPGFVVASVMLGETSKNNYLRRLRSEGGHIYTYPDYINLFGGKGVASGSLMMKRYHVTGFPSILLLDKHGRIYSATLPVIYGDIKNKAIAENQLKLTALIEKALAEP